MELLKQRIEQDGQIIGTEILKVDSFLNHRIDTKFLEQIGAEFRRRFDDVASGIDSIITVEASGIAVACFTARFFDEVPVIFAKKQKPNTMNSDYFTAKVESFTKNQTSNICIAKKYIKKKDTVLIIDDFLAHGNAALGLAEIAGQSGATVAGIGIVIEKSFQGGAQKIRDAGYRLESLSAIKEMKDGKVYF